MIIHVKSYLHLNIDDLDLFFQQSFPPVIKALIELFNLYW